MRLLKHLLPLMALLLGSAGATAQYNPADPPEPGVNFTLTRRCIPADAASGFPTTSTYAFGNRIHVSASPNSGFHFLYWADEKGDTVSDIRDFYFVMPPRNVELTAHFRYDPASPGEPVTPSEKSKIAFVISPSEGGYFSSSYAGTYEVGSNHRFTANPNTNYKFINWTRDGVEIGAERTLDYTVPIGDHTLVANFEFNPGSPSEPGPAQIIRKLTRVSNPREVWDPYTEDKIEGKTYTVEPRSAASGFEFICWTDEKGDTVSKERRFDFTMPAHNVTFTANYRYNPGSPGEPGTPNPPGSVGENMVAWPRFAMYDDTHVMILCETPGAQIHYTTDGSVPTAESTLYEKPFYVESNLLVRAVAMKEGMEDSPVTPYQVHAYKADMPRFVFEYGKIKIVSDTPGATIRYTLDFTEPNEESEVYKEPFTPEENCRIKAYASKEGLTDSGVAFFLYRHADFELEAPKFELVPLDKLVILPPVEGGQTRYTLDGTVPGPDSALYTDTLTLTGNCTVKAYTTHINHFDSPVGEFIYNRSQLPTPTANFADLRLTLACADSVAQIRFTLDGTQPTAESELYAEPLALTEDCTVKFFAMRSGYNDSETAVYEFRRVDHQVATPTISYDPAKKAIIMECATEGATIRYTDNNTLPMATSGTVYTDTIAVDGNRTYTARAFKEGLFDSEARSYTVSDQKVPAPSAAYAAHTVTLSCPDTDAQIRYTLDGSMPGSTSTLYTEPLPMTGDCTVRFIATRSHWTDSDEAEYRFVLADWKEKEPTIELRFRWPAIYVFPSSTEAAMKIWLDDFEIYEGHQEYQSMGMLPQLGYKSISARMIAANPDRYDSDLVSEEIRFNPAPQITYDGHGLSFSGIGDYDAQGYIQLGDGVIKDAIDVKDGDYIEVSDFGSVQLNNYSDTAFASATVELYIDYYNTGSEAGARRGHRLEEAFADWGSDLWQYDELRVVGETNCDDLAFLGTLPNLTVLELTAKEIPGTMPRKDCFSDSRLETLITPCIPADMVDYAGRLTSIVWTDSVKSVPKHACERYSNLIVYVSEAGLASEISNRCIVVADGKTDRIELERAAPFHPWRPFVVEEAASYYRSFFQQTEVGVSRGWETIALPFDVRDIFNPDAGHIQPFATWDGSDWSPRPFWLYRATPTGWEPASQIEAGVPYIISMPNDPEYIYWYNISGPVHFYSNSGITLGGEDSAPKAEQWVDGLSFEACFMPVDKTVRAINTGGQGGFLPGSVFTEQASPAPFEAYVRGGDVRKSIPVFEDWDPGSVPTLSLDGGIAVDSPAPGALRVSSMRDMAADIVTPDGRTAARLQVKAGTPALAEGLPAGVYIVAGIKIMVK